MGEIITMRRRSPAAKRPPEALNKGKTLCRSGFHKWQIVKDRPFDVREGRLISRYRCVRCGAARTEAR